MLMSFLFLFLRRGDGCGRRGSPAVFARVSAARDDFIYPTICENSRAPPSFCGGDPQQAPEVPGDTDTDSPEGGQQQRKDASGTSKCGSVAMDNGRGGAAAADKDCTSSRIYGQEGGGLRTRRKLKGTKKQ